MVTNRLTNRGSKRYAGPRGLIERRATRVLVLRGSRNTRWYGEKTVRNNLTEVFGQLGVSDRLQLAIYAYRRGLAEIPG